MHACLPAHRYVLLYFYYQWLAFKDLSSLPYVQYRLTSIAVRVEVRRGCRGGPPGWLGAAPCRELPVCGRLDMG